MEKIIRNSLNTLGFFLLTIGFKLPQWQEDSINNLFRYIHLRDLLKQLKINCVLDVGANEGQFARNLRKIGYRGHILSFEPNPDSFHHLSENFKKDPFWRGYNFALGSSNTTATFNISNQSVFSSFLQAKAGLPKINRTCEVEVKRLDSILDELVVSIPQPHIFLKVDTQGYDMEVFQGASACVERILGLQSEVSVQSIYEAMPNYLESLQCYESSGFQLADLFVVNRDSRSTVIEFDCLMLRPQ